jgi:hypothetical protein
MISYIARGRRGGGNVGIGFIDFQDSLLNVKHFRRAKHWIFKAWRVYPSDACFWSGEAVPARPSVHRRDEPARLSLGMVASQQSLLPFRLAKQL